MQNHRLPFWSRWRPNAGDESKTLSIAREPTASDGKTIATIDAPPARANLADFDEIYRASRIPNPKLGYSVLKIADMLESEHLRGWLPEIKRGSVLMALEAAGVQLEEVLQDASQRQRALCGYEAVQQKRLEELETHKAQDIANLQAEMERLTVECQAHIRSSRDELAQEQERFRTWQTRKGMEAQRLSDAIAVCVAQGKTTNIETFPTALEQRPHRSVAGGTELPAQALGS